MRATLPPRPLPRARAVLAAIVVGGVVGLAAGVPAAATPDGRWYLDALRVRQAQQISTGKGVTVAVIDSGIDKTRPALSGSLVPGKCFGSAEAIPPTMDDNGHGTAMAGLIAGNGSDHRHILGLAPDAKLMPLCVSGEDTTHDAALGSLTPAIRYAADHGAQVISMSLGAYENHALDKTVAKLHDAIAYAESRNVVLVAGVGNLGKDHEGILSPASLPGVVAVAGIGTNGKSWKGSVTSEQVALTAPAQHILSTDTTNKFKDNKPVPSDGYQITGGTSAATALVAGTAALVRSKYPKLDAANVINRLIKTADHQGSPGRNPQYGYGIVDPVEALTADVALVKANPLGQLESRSAKTSPSDQPAATAEGDDESGNAGWVIAGIGILIALAIAASIAYRSRRTRSAKAEAGGWQPGGQPTARTPPPSPPAPRQQQPPTGATPPTSRGTPPAGGATPPTSRATPPIGGAAPSVGGQDPPDKYEIHWRKP